MKIKVEQRHIDAGVRCDPRRDPVTLALKDTGLFFDVRVAGDTVKLVRGRHDLPTVILLPQEAVDFVMVWDLPHTPFGKLGNVEPFEFDLALE